MVTVRSTNLYSVVLLISFTFHAVGDNITNDIIQEISCEIPSIQVTRSKKQWTVIIFMAADNDLRGFAARNIKQMAAIGSNSFLNIVVELHIRISGNKKITRRYFIENGKINHVNATDPHSQRMDSGDQQTLISCCQWAMRDYPADQYALILWNHGTGIVDPTGGRIVHATELFTFNPAINKLELDRSVGFLDFIERLDPEHRGICWDDSSGNYLTNQKLQEALDHICDNFLGGRKIAIIGFDACLMAMVEIADLIKHRGHIMVGSQEVELGTGWNYQLVLSQFLQGSPTPSDFGRHIVHMYEKTYNKVTNDYTLSAIDLDNINKLDGNINAVSHALLECLNNQLNNSVRISIKNCRDKGNCTHFDEPSYIDLHHFYTNLYAHIGNLQVTGDNANNAKQHLGQLLQEGCALLQELALANTASKNLAKARGLSIYFPERKIHFSYYKTPFAKNNEWASFLTQYLMA